MIKTKNKILLFIIVFLFKIRGSVEIEYPMIPLKSTSQTLLTNELYEVQKKSITERKIYQYRTFKNLNKSIDNETIEIEKQYINTNNNLDELYNNIENYNDQSVTKSPQKIALTFLGGTESESGYYPPDSMGAVGPSQFFVTLNGLMRTFNKTTGKPDNVINVAPETFFKIKSPNFASDPRIRYDRLSKRWFALIMNINGNGATGNLSLAVSNTSVITSSTIWKIYTIITPANQMPDYPTFGISNNAIFIGTNQFAASGKFVNCLAIVVQKQSALSGGPLIVHTFPISPTAANNMFTPQGVDNFNVAGNKGYFIGASNTAFGKLEIIRVNNPGSTSPTVEKFGLTVSPTAFPIEVSQPGTTSKLDGIDDRLMCAHIRGTSLWTVHQIGVNNKGIASNTADRNGCRWYELTLPAETAPLSGIKIKQIGTLFDSTTNASSYWMGSIMTNGQNSMALCCSNGGPKNLPNPAAAGRLATDPINSIRPATIYFKSTTFYVLERWGDYSYVSVDPQDDQTMWTIQEYSAGQTNWATRVAKLLAPPPATPISVSPSSVARGISSVNITITGQSVNGSAYFEPGPTFVKHLVLTIPGVKVNKIVSVAPTKVVANISTVGSAAGAKVITITNPDGQIVSASNLFKVT